MIDDVSQAPPMGRNLTVIGASVSAVWLLPVIAYVIVRWSDVSGLPPNEMGDFLAGVFAPLAFFWLVLGFFQQGTELRHSSQALWLQGEELRNSVEQQRQLVEVTREQLAFESDRLRTAEAQAHRQAQPLLKLTAGGSMGTGTGRKQTFTLTNHGQACTGLRLTFGEVRGPVSIDRLTPGERKDFTLDIGPDFTSINVSITYIDGLQNAGEEVIKICADGHDFSFDRL